jgi:hypothetical protein
MKAITIWRGIRTTEFRIEQVRPGDHYDGETLARLAACDLEVVREYCERGCLVPSGIRDEEFLFDEEAVAFLRRLQELRVSHGMGLDAISYVADLLHQVRGLESEVRMLRARLNY